MAGMQETDRLTMKNGITYLLQDAKARAQLAELLAEVMEKYGADNPPPYPVTSVNGQTGDVDIPTVDLPVSVQNGGTGATTAAQAAKNLNVLPLGEVVTKIPSGADLNDYVLPGVYAIGLDDTAATIANIPSQFAGTLRVFASIGAEITASSIWKYLIQEYVTYTGARYQRNGESGSGAAVTWGAWKTIYTSADISVPVPVSQGGTGADNAADARTNLGVPSKTSQLTNDSKYTTLLDVYPVGSIYMSVNSTSPATLFGGTWEQIQDRFLLAAGSTYTAGSTGGEATHTLTVTEMPSHRHGLTDSPANAAGRAGTGTSHFGTVQMDVVWASGYQTDATGGGQAHNNMPPYLAVYMWKRTA